MAKAVAPVRVACCQFPPTVGDKQGNLQQCASFVERAAAAHSNSICIAAADCVGSERGQPFIGQSLIVSHTGWPVGGPASPTGEAIVFADLDLAAARRARRWNDFNHPLRDRRADTYHP